MPADVLERVRADINDRLAALAGAVSESQRLESALAVLGDLPSTDDVRSNGLFAATGNSRRKTRAAARPAKARGPRAKRRSRKRSAPGSNDPLVLQALQGQSEPLDIKAVAQKTGLSKQTASYTLKKLAGSGLLTQSAGGRGMPKLVFSLAKAGEEAPAGEVTSETATSKTTTPAARKAKRKARKKARRRTKAPAA
jgi:DNA-binding transcriptional ArsR family regulator